MDKISLTLNTSFESFEIPNVQPFPKEALRPDH